MTSTERELQKLLANPPPDLVAHFDAVAAMPDPRPYLDLAEAISTSLDFHELHDLATALGLVFLDDTNSSNYHAFISVGPLAGNILYLSHDGDTKAVFPSLAAYLAAVRSSREQGEIMFESYDQPPIQARDQAGVTARIAQLIEEDEEPELLVLLASWDASSDAVLEQLVCHPNFYVAEAAGDTMARRARPELLSFANTLAGHPHVQAANAGKRAMAAIQRPEKRNP